MGRDGGKIRSETLRRKCGRVGALFEGFWRRHVTGRPQSYQIYIRLPTELSDDRSILGDVGVLVDDLTRACEGMLDVYGTRDGLVVSSDDVSASAFDEEAFEECLERIETLYDDVYSLAVVTKWQTVERRAVRSYIVVPVKPLFPRDRLESREATTASTGEP